MSNEYSNDSMLDMFIFETTQLIEQLEQLILTNEKENKYSSSVINEIFRIMHTIKGSSTMMIFNNIATLAHGMEDLFYFIREENPNEIDYSLISDLVLDGIDFIKVEVEKIRNGDPNDGDASALIDCIKEFLSVLKENNNSLTPSKPRDKSSEKQQYYISPAKTIPSGNENLYKAIIYFEDGCEMENIRAYSIIHNLKDISQEIHYIPEDIIDNDDTIETIREKGFTVFLKSQLSYGEVHEVFMQTVFLKDLQFVQLENDGELQQFHKINTMETKKNYIKTPSCENSPSTHQSIISVSVNKLDTLMDLVGEMVIAEAMVIQNPDLQDLELDNFHKAARQLNKITSDIQDMVMSIRMVPLSATFHKMHRVVRDMSKKLGKNVELHLIGEDTEVDKNIIEQISDPLMHLVRNAIDHGIETSDERRESGKSPTGNVTLEAKNAGSDVLIIIKDDGKGLSREKILQKAKKNGLLHKPEEEMSDKEVFNLISLPGFSTKENVTEFSGRGVGMDVVSKNIETVGGSVSVDSVTGHGTTITLKIPLTLAIIDGMNLRVGASRYTIPTISIKESFRPSPKDIFTDPDGNEMIMVRGECYSIIRLHELYKVKNSTTDISKGILIMVEYDDKTLCIFADELLGQQQVVVKSLPQYIRNFKKIIGLAGCTLLGDGSISLILDIAGLSKIDS